MQEHFFKFSIFSVFSELVQGVSNRSFGNMKFGRWEESEIIKNRQQFLNFLNIEMANSVFPRQIHSANVTIVSSKDRRRGSIEPKTAIPATDGLITQEKNLFLSVTVADCLPVLIYDPILKICAVIHAGWRGIIGQIMPQAVGKFKNFGSDPHNLVVGIGPGICQKHFVCKKDVLSFFLDSYPSATMVRNNDGYVDLKKAVLIDLKKHGLSQNNIEISSICTVCENGTYGSFRKEKENAPHSMAVIGVK